MKISPAYLEQNRKLHEGGSYGLSGQRWAPTILNVCKSNYDPCIPGLDATPEPADIVACTDVLEHIEPECLDEVLDDLKRVTRKAGFFVIATRPAKKTLPDGRNAHLIQEGAQWWLPRLEARFRVSQVREMTGEFAVVVHPL